MKKKLRFAHIDILRAAAIVGIVGIHLLERSLDNPSAWFVWNYSQFAVVALVFCSGYVLMARYPVFHTASDVNTWYVRRFTRILAPYYVYFAAHYALWSLLPSFVSGRLFDSSWQYVVGSVTMTGGIDVGWLPLLFLQMAVLFPKFALAISRKKRSIWLYIIGAFLLTIWITVWPPSFVPFRLIMWIPWSLVFFAGMIFAVQERKFPSYAERLNRYISWGAGAGMFFLLYHLLWFVLGRSIRLMDNKYPPNLYHLSYGFGMTCVLLAASKKARGLLAPVWAGIAFLSIHAYTIFFVHYIVLDMLRTTGLLL